MSRAQRKIGKKMRGRTGRKWRVMAIVAVSVASCDSLWTPFLMEREDCPADPVSCAETEVRPKLVLIRKGSFQMGSPTTEPGRYSNEVQHPVTLTTDIWMAESEVTQRQYRNLTGSSPSYFKGDDLPVEQVSWYDAVAYCNALSVRENLTPCYQINGTTVDWADGVKCTGYRLPTEAEWEYAANPASGSRTVYAGSDTVDGVAWYSNNSGSTTHAVKTKTANGRGLYDLSGNVWEWVWDWYQGNYEALQSSDPIGPKVQPSPESRVIRGGSWGYTASNARVARRIFNTPAFRNFDLGYRLVRSTP
jgi:formylglycine-generating enzyme required for sulfatase activity